MNYLKIYSDLCVRRELNPHPSNVYTEKHRILPGCMGGKYEDGNVVRLSPEEHLLAHELLIKIHPTEKNLVFAVGYMLRKVNGNKNKTYGYLRRQLAKRISEINTGSTRTFSDEHRKNLAKSNARRKGKYSKETKKKISEAVSKSQIGKPLSNHHKERISISLKGNKNVTNWLTRVCPHCGLDGRGPNMSRYHFKNCRENVELTKIR